jgi:hypothetical protein
MLERREPPGVERERFERLRLVLDCLNRNFVDSRQAFRELVSLLDRFQHMKTRALPPSDLSKLETIGTQCDWVLFRAGLKQEFAARLTQAKRSRVAPSHEDFLQTFETVPIEHLRNSLVFLTPNSFDAFKYGQSGSGERNECYFETRVWMFSGGNVSPEDVLPAVRQYLLDMFFADLIGMKQEVIGVCEECGNVYVNRRAVIRRFCCPRCRWKHAQHTTGAAVSSLKKQVVGQFKLIS